MDFLYTLSGIAMVAGGLYFWLDSKSAATAAAKAKVAAEEARVAELMSTEQGRFQLQAERQERHHAERLAAQERQHAEQIEEMRRRQND